MASPSARRGARSLEVGLSRPPHAILEAAGIDDAIDPHGARAGAETVEFSLTTAAGRSALGSTFLPFEPNPLAYEARLRAGGAAYVPAIADAPTIGLRACARPLALDGRPLVGPVPGVDRLFVAAGHGPWGLSTGAASGAHAAGLVLGRPDAVPATIRAALDPARFGARPAERPSAGADAIHAPVDRHQEQLARLGLAERHWRPGRRAHDRRASRSRGVRNRSPRSAASTGRRRRRLPAIAGYAEPR